MLEAQATLAAKKRSKSAAPVSKAVIAKGPIAKAQTKASTSSSVTAKATLRAKHLSDFQKAAKELVTVFDKENAKFKETNKKLDD